MGPGQYATSAESPPMGKGEGAEWLPTEARGAVNASVLLPDEPEDLYSLRAIYIGSLSQQIVVADLICLKAPR